MRAGRLRHRVTLQSPTTARNSFGEPIATFATYANVWADIRPLTGRERYAAQQVQASTTHQVRIRFRTDVEAIHRVQWVSHGATRTLDITAVLDPEERHTELLLLCSEAAD